MGYIPTVDMLGVNEADITPDKIIIDLRYRVQRPTSQEIIEIDKTMEYDFNQAILQAGISQKNVKLEEYYLQSACETENGMYDCFEAFRSYRITLSTDLEPVVALMHLLADKMPPEKLEIRYYKQDCRYDLDCLEANALRNAQYRADILADALNHHLGEHVTVRCYDPPVDPSYCVFRMRTPEDLRLVNAEMLKLPYGTFKLRFTLKAEFSTYKR